MSNELKLQNELLTEDESKVGLTQQLVKEGIILLDQLVLNVLKDGTHLGHLKHLKAALILDFFVGAIIECQVLHWCHAIGVLEGAAELSKHFVICVHNEPQIGSAALLAEQEDKFVVQAQPVEEHQRCTD